MMLLTSNSTNLTAQAQQNAFCITVDSHAEKISKVCAYCLIVLVSFFGNVFIITIVLKHRDLRKTVNYFTVNMVVSDLIFSLVLFPFQITGLVTGSSYWSVRGILASIFCKLFHFANPVSIQVSAQMLVWIAIYRFVAVFFPSKNWPHFNQGSYHGYRFLLDFCRPAQVLFQMLRCISHPISIGYLLVLLGFFRVLLVFHCQSNNLPVIR